MSPSDRLSSVKYVIMLSPPAPSDLLELFEGPVLLDGARHQAFLALTEEGVEAGAATATMYSRSFPFFSATQTFRPAAVERLG